jgi:hypothetical protein
MYITNLKHLLNASEKMPEEMPKEARELTGFLTLIVDSSTTSVSHTLTSTEVRCFEKGCDGLIKAAIRPDTDEIHWYCPLCESEGLINNWQGTKWDHREGEKESS